MVAMLSDSSEGPYTSDMAMQPRPNCETTGPLSPNCSVFKLSESSPLAGKIMPAHFTLSPCRNKSRIQAVSDGRTKLLPVESPGGAADRSPLRERWEWVQIKDKAPAGATQLPHAHQILKCARARARELSLCSLAVRHLCYIFCWLNEDPGRISSKENG